VTIKMYLDRPGCNKLTSLIQVIDKLDTSGT